MAIIATSELRQCALTRYCVQHYFFSGLLLLILSSGRGSFSSRFRLRRTQGARVCTSVQVWVLAGLRGAGSGHTKSRTPANNRGKTFRPASAKQIHGNPKPLGLTPLLCCCSSSTTAHSRPQETRRPRYSSRASNSYLCDSHEGCCCVCARVCMSS